MKWLGVSLFLMVASPILSENVFLLDITPEEAQKYIAAQSLDVSYAPKQGENPLPAVKNDAGDFIYQGRKYENPGDYTEEHYLAHQYHGQDGLGRASFGYSDWNQGHVQARNINGDVRGSYKYVDPTGKDFIVNYWSDSLGFHHEDNRPVVVLEPVTDTPAVKAAREDHFRKYNEIAEEARLHPDPNSDVYNRNANKFDEDQAEINQALEIIGNAPQQREASEASRISEAVAAVQPHEEQLQYQESKQQQQYQEKPHAEPKQYYQPDDEPTGPPRGFFYSFDYPVQLGRDNVGRNLKPEYEPQQQPEHQPEPEQEHEITKRHTDVKDHPIVENVEKGEDSISTDALRVSAVHDAQVHPKQKKNNKD